jgi:hypothetical protein
MSARNLFILRELDDSYARQEAKGFWVAWGYAGLGDKDEAFAWLERGFQERGTLHNAIIF